MDPAGFYETSMRDIGSAETFGFALLAIVPLNPGCRIEFCINPEMVVSRRNLFRVVGLAALFPRVGLQKAQPNPGLYSTTPSALRSLKGRTLPFRGRGPDTMLSIFSRDRSNA